MHTHRCVLIEKSIEIGMLNFWLGLLVTALMKEIYFNLSKIKYLAFFITFCFVVSLAKMVTLTNNIVYQKSAQYRKYIWYEPMKVLAVPEQAIVVCNVYMIHDMKPPDVSSFLKPKKNPI